MEYSNPQIPDDINISKGHPLAAFFKMLAMATLMATILIVTMTILANFFAARIPFSYEKKLAQQFLPERSEEELEARVYLQSLADRILRENNLSDKFQITVHYEDDDVVNAFATLGGHVYFYRGLVEKLESEEALAMVMAHEIAHIVHRDPIHATGRLALTSIALSAVFSSVDNTVLRNIVGSGELLFALQFSRQQEQAADDAGVNWIKNTHGNACGALELFAFFSQLQPNADFELPQFFYTHPQSKEREQRVREQVSDDCQDWPRRRTANPLFDAEAA